MKDVDQFYTIQIIIRGLENIKNNEKSSNRVVENLGDIRL